MEHRRVKEVDQVLGEMYAANPQQETRELAAKTLESIGDRTGATRWRK